MRAAAESAEVGLQLLGIAVEVRRQYADRKTQLAALDFDDLLIEAVRLFDERPDVLERRLPRRHPRIEHRSEILSTIGTYRRQE